MKTKSNFLRKPGSPLFLTAIVLLFWHPCGPSCAGFFDPAHYSPSADPAQLSAESPHPVEPAWPEQFVDPALDQSLSLVIPQSYREGLQLDTGYDRWQGLPTVQADYFVPVKHWSDKSIFFSPRVSLTGTEETYSVGAGIRRMVNSDTLIGFHAFHDWRRARGSQDSFLKEAGVGFELSALPGNYSDLSLSMNAYMPTNERNRVSRGDTVLIQEAMLQGFDARASMLLPPLTDRLDIRLDAQGHAFRTDAGTLWGYNTGITVGSRDGMFNVSLAREMKGNGPENYSLQGTVSLVFDWRAILDGENPLSAPYGVPDVRFGRKVRDSLYTRATRQYDVPMKRNEHQVTLAAAVMDDVVTMRGQFAGLADSNVTVQVSQSPWRDVKQLRTDSSGSYSARLTLPPGDYGIRLIHKPTGLVSGVTRIIIQDE
ncbi:MAG: inverse autotransporter beta domain-containing protein [Pseudomonadota bacterium]